MQQDPNGTGMVVQSQTACLGARPRPTPPQIAPHAHFGDGLNTHGYLRSAPPLNRDALGLNSYGEVGIVQWGIATMVQSLLNGVTNVAASTGALVNVAGTWAIGLGTNGVLVAGYNWDLIIMMASSNGGGRDWTSGGGGGSGEFSNPPPPERNLSELRRCTDGDIEKLKRAGHNVHEVKDSGSRFDLYKDNHGNVYQGAKNGQGVGEFLWINLNAP